MRRKKREKVSIVKCTNYDQDKVDGAIEKALKLIDFKFKRNSKVLIKPNIVGAFPKHQKAITTHPSLIKAVCKILKKKKCKIFIGDSPFTNYVEAFKKSGIGKLGRYGKILVFEQQKLVKIRDKKAKLLKNFRIAKIIREADLIIDMPKLKTHMLTDYTGAIKNLYGCIPGGLKQRLHFKAKGDKKFSTLLVDIYQNVKPELAIMDGVVGMEGNGPTSGKPKKANLILASKNPVSLDVVSCKIMGFNPKKIHTIRVAVNRGLGNYKFELVGASSLPKIKFKKPEPYAERKVGKRIRRLFRERPIIVDEKKCIQCGLCSRKCPAKAITLKPYPVIDRKKCIRCYCCMEICPQHALRLRK